jgi:hypothetical protein
MGGGKGFYIRLWCGGRGMQSDRHSYPSDGYNALWRRFVHGNRGGPSRVYPQVISPGIYSLTRREKTQNLGSDILNLGSRKLWKFPKTRSFI